MGWLRSSCRRNARPPRWRRRRQCTALAEMPDMPLLPPFIAPARFANAEAALARAREIYDNSVDHLRNALQSFVNGEALTGRVRAFYPFVRVHTDTVARADSRLSYGFVAGPGTFETTLTRPDLFAGYYLEQFRLLLREPRRRARDRHQRAADPGALLLRRARPHRGQPDAGAAPAAARPVRPARPRRDGRRHRQRHLRRRAGAAAAARALHRAAGRLLAASPAPLHRHRPRALPELRAVHELPVLHRRVRASRPRGHGRQRRGRRLRRLRRARQRDRAAAPARRRRRATPSARRRRACRRCRPTT